MYFKFQLDNNIFQFQLKLHIVKPSKEITILSSLQLEGLIIYIFQLEGLTYIKPSNFILSSLDNMKLHIVKPSN